MEKLFIDKLLGRFKIGTLTVTYWDGETRIYGSGEPSADLKINDVKAARAVMKNLSLGVGESYMNGTLETSDLQTFFNLAFQNMSEFRPLWAKFDRVGKFMRNTKKTQEAQIQHHYDLGNDFYKMWLDKDTMTYTCAYFKTRDDSIEKAQAQKIDHVLKKLQLKKGMRVVEFGCGWGHLLVTAAKKYGVSGLGVTLSTEQHAYASKLAKKEKVDHLVKFELKNYQDLMKLDEQFDRVYSVGIFEHVGENNQDQYFRVVDHLLKPGGISLLHSITDHYGGHEPWINKYIFPGGYLHRPAEMVKYLEPYDFRLLDYESLRPHYAMTLDAWWVAFEKHKKKVIDMFGEEFYRMWRFYLLACAGNFRHGSLDLSQLVFSKGINNELPLTREHIYR